ncbi:MAG: hypothetical protein ACK4SL_00570 [Candidatus Paceibacteria bacterium]
MEAPAVIAGQPAIRRKVCRDLLSQHFGLDNQLGRREVDLLEPDEGELVGQVLLDHVHFESETVAVDVAGQSTQRKYMAHLGLANETSASVHGVHRVVFAGGNGDEKHGFVVHVILHAWI